MKYMGSKLRFAKDILPIMLKERKENQVFVDLFAGGMNIIDKVNGYKIANDKNRYLIAMWKGLINNEKYPIEISKEFYSDVRDCFHGRNNKYSDDIIGWVGFMASFNGRFFDGGYSGITSKRNYITENIRNILKQLPNVKDVKFYDLDYRDIILPNNSIVYCDIPYKNKKQYCTSKDFNHTIFWEWCRQKRIEGHNIYISEYDAPSDFKCIWERETKTCLNPGLTKFATEKLFTLS